jgi:uncharacterized membrane protein
MAGAVAVVTLVIMLRALLPTFVALARASSVATVGRALPIITVLAGLLLPLLLREEQLAIYARRWQRFILLGVILCRVQPATGVFKR